MKAKYDSEYHSTFRQYNNKSYEERGCLTKRLRYLEKRVGAKPIENIRQLSNGEIAENIFELEKVYGKTQMKIQKILQNYKH